MGSSSDTSCLRRFSKYTGWPFTKKPYGNTIRFADDTVIIAESMENLQTQLDAVNSECIQMGLDIDIDKTKYMITSKRPTNNEHLTLGGQQIEIMDFKNIFTVTFPTPV